MQQNLEIEAKVLLKEEDYLILLNDYFDKPYYQTNFYFDTKDRQLHKNGYSLRIREKECEAEITLKNVKLEGRLESNFQIPKTEITNYLSSPKQILNLITNAIPNYFLNLNIILLGSLTTLRYDKKYKNGLLSLDKNTYNNKVDYEIEYEGISAEEAENTLLGYLSLHNIKGSLSNISKSKRAIEFI